MAKMVLLSHQQSSSVSEMAAHRSLRYVIVSAARNEAQYIELTIASVVSQTFRPLKWVIVSDGSTDGTDEIVQKHAAAHPWIELLRMADRKQRDFGGKVHCIRAGLAQIGDLSYDVFVNLDADISFGPDYFDFLMSKLEENPKLGIVGSALNEGGASKYDYRLTLLAHVSGPCQVFRRECYESIDGYVPLKQGGVDFSAVWKARARGWETQTFTEIAYEHHRPMSSAKHGGMKLWSYAGRMDYVQGNHPVWEMLRCLNYMRSKPYVLGGALTFGNYLWHALRGSERVIPDDAVRLLRREQMIQLRKIIRGAPSGVRFSKESMEMPSSTSNPCMGPDTERELATEKKLDHIAVCICTFKRPKLLKRLLNDLTEQETDGLFTFSIVVADNDGARSAEPFVAKFSAGTKIGVTYCVQPEQNISLTRNVAIANATGNYIAFIDDDEFPIKRWLVTLFKACERYGVDGVLGPVKCHFEENAPKWVIKGKFYERPTYPTGFVIDWRKGRTGNVLFKRQIVEGIDQPFSREFHRAGDQDFFRRMIEKGHKFIWCDEAQAFEEVLPSRWTRSFMLKRALLRGAISMQHPTSKFTDMLKGLVAVPVYAIALPFALLLGQHRFMDILVRMFDHLGRLLTFVGLKPVKSQLLTD